MVLDGPLVGGGTMCSVREGPVVVSTEYTEYAVMSDQKNSSDLILKSYIATENSLFLDVT